MSSLDFNLKNKLSGNGRGVQHQMRAATFLFSLLQAVTVLVSTVRAILSPSFPSDSRKLNELGKQSAFSSCASQQR